MDRLTEYFHGDQGAWANIKALKNKGGYFTACVDHCNDHNEDCKTGCKIHQVIDRLAAMREQQDIVRCEECEYGENCTCIVCESGNTVVCQKQHKHVEKNHFCSYGQRRLESNQH